MNNPARYRTPDTVYKTITHPQTPTQIRKKLGEEVFAAIWSKGIKNNSKPTKPSTLPRCSADKQALSSLYVGRPRNSMFRFLWLASSCGFGKAGAAIGGAYGLPESSPASIVTTKSETSHHENHWRFLINRRQTKDHAILCFRRPPVLPQLPPPCEASEKYYCLLAKQRNTTMKSHSSLTNNTAIAHATASRHSGHIEINSIAPSFVHTPQVTQLGI